MYLFYLENPFSEMVILELEVKAHPMYSADNDKKCIDTVIIFVLQIETDAQF